MEPKPLWPNEGWLKAGLPKAEEGPGAVVEEEDGNADVLLGFPCGLWFMAVW